MSKKDKSEGRAPTRTISVILGEAAYKLELVQLPNNSLDPDKPLLCPCCKTKLRVVTETQQHGKWEDKYTLLLACVPCIRAYLYNYVISLIELSGSSVKE